MLSRRRVRQLAPPDAGFSLIEVIAALVIFSVVSLGLIPLLTASLRASDTARGDTIGKNVAVKAMERLRGLPFYISYATSTTKVDVLDLYYPTYAGANKTNPADVFYRTVCPSTPTNPACPVDNPANYTVTFEARFVNAVASGVQPSPGERVTNYSTVAPATTYAWNSTNTDNPPRQQLRVDVIVSWTTKAARARTYRLSSILSDRDFGGLKLSGSATVQYGIEFHADFDTRKNVSGTPLNSAFSLVGPNGQSSIEGRRLSTARQQMSAGNLSLTRFTNNSTGTDLPGSGSPGNAANTPVLVAPPDASFPDTSEGQITMTHPDFANALLAGMGPSTVSGIKSLASSLSPQAAGTAKITAGTTGTGPAGEYIWSRDPQISNQDYNGFNMPTTVGGVPPSIGSLVSTGGLPAPTLWTGLPNTAGSVAVAYTEATTNATSVHTRAVAGFDRLLFEKTNFIPDPAPVSTTTGGARVDTLSGGQGAVIVVDNFEAVATCDSNTNGTGTSSSGYKATIYYWSEPVFAGGNGDGRINGSYVRLQLNVSHTSPANDPLAALMALNNKSGPLVYDASSAGQNIWMFPHGLKGKYFGSGNSSTNPDDYGAYVLDWDSEPRTTARTTPTTDAVGNAVSLVDASVDSAINITTDDLDITKSVDSHVTVSMGTLSCVAQDLR